MFQLDGRLGNWTLATYDTPATIALKAALAKTNTIRELFAWEVSGDMFYRSASLWNSICNNKFLTY